MNPIKIMDTAICLGPVKVVLVGAAEFLSDELGEPQSKPDGFIVLVYLMFHKPVLYLVEAQTNYVYGTSGTGTISAYDPQRPSIGIGGRRANICIDNTEELMPRDVYDVIIGAVKKYCGEI